MATDPRWLDILDAVMVRLAVPNGAGSYFYNTSTPGQVIVDHHPLDDIPTSSPFPLWQITPLSDGEGEPGNTLEAMIRKGRFVVIGYCEAADDTGYGRIAAGMRMYQDAAIALESDPFLESASGVTGGIIRDPCGLFAFEAGVCEYAHSSKFAFCAFEYHFIWKTTRGVGA